MDDITRSEILGHKITGNSILVSGEVTAGDLGAGALYVRGTSAGLRAAMDANGVWWNLTLPDRVAHIGWFGAVADNADGALGTDNRSMIQAAIDALGSTGGVVQVPAGRFRCSGSLLIDDSATGTATGSNASLNPRRRIRGLGARASKIVFDGGNFKGVEYRGTAANDAGTALYSSILEDVLLFKGDGQGVGFFAGNVSHLDLKQAYFLQWEWGSWMEDVQEASFYNCGWTYNVNGFFAKRQAVTQPNSLNFYNCIVGGNQRCGLDILSASVLNFNGGSIESNGSQLGYGLNRWGMRVFWEANETTPEGSNAFNLNGTYIERNAGTGDILLVSYSQPLSLSITGCTFNRAKRDPAGAGDYGRNCLYIDNNGTGATRISAHLAGNAFRGLPRPYTPSAARPCIDAYDKLRVVVSENGNLWGDPIEKPDFGSWGVNFTEEFANTAWAETADGNGTVNGKGANVSAVTKTSTGVYQVAFVRPLERSVYHISITPILAYRYFSVTAKTPSTFTVQFADMTGNVADTRFSFSVTGGAAVLPPLS
jgi:hypothetical protein